MLRCERCIYELCDASPWPNGWVPAWNRLNWKISRMSLLAAMYNRVCSYGC